MNRLEECQHHTLEVQVQSALQDDNLSWNCARLHEGGDLRDIAKPSEAPSRDVGFARLGAVSVGADEDHLVGDLRRLSIDLSVDLGGFRPVADVTDHDAFAGRLEAS